MKLKKLDKPQAKEEVDRIDAIRLAFEEERLKKIRKQEADTLKRLKPELLERSDVALILNKSDLVYCIPCKEAVDVLKHDMHEEEEEHKALSFEWKRKCLHFAEKMNYRCLRKGDVREDGELVKSSVVYEAVVSQVTRNFSRFLINDPSHDIEAGAYRRLRDFTFHACIHGHDGGRAEQG